jgi:predicted nucleic acid-binding protein
VRVITCPVIIQETLQGIKEDSKFKKVKESFAGFEALPIDPLKAALGAATLCRKILKHGIVIRKSNDGVIAFYAIFHKATLLHYDQDFEKISQITSLKILS